MHRPAAMAPPKARYGKSGYKPVLRNQFSDYCNASCAGRRALLRLRHARINTKPFSQGRTDDLSRACRRYRLHAQPHRGIIGHCRARPVRGFGHGHGQRNPRGGGALRHRGNRAHQPRQRHARRAARERRGCDAGWRRGSLPQMGRGGLGQRGRAQGARRAGLAVRALHGAHRDVERRKHGLRAQSAADAGGRARDRGAWLGGAAAKVSAEARDRRVDRLHAAHRAAGWLRLALHENPRDARRRRQLQDHRRQDFHHLWRALPDG